MIKLNQLDNTNEIISNLYLTNAILSQIIMFFYDSSENIEYGKNDKIIFKDQKDAKLVNKIMNVLLDGRVDTNEKLNIKLKDIFSEIDDGHKLKKNINNLFKEKNNDSKVKSNRFDKLKKNINKLFKEKNNDSKVKSNRFDKLKKNINKLFKEKNNDSKVKSNRFDKLKKRGRLNLEENQIKSKSLEGFVSIYEKPDGLFGGDIQFKLINKPASDNQLEKYAKSSDWQNSKYFNIWMRKEGLPEEIYLTKLLNLLYGGKEALYKVRSTGVGEELLIKFIPNVQTYEQFSKEILPGRSTKDLLSDEKKEELREKFDKKSVLKFAIINLLIMNSDVNSKNLLLKNECNKLKLIPIDPLEGIDYHTPHYKKFDSSADEVEAINSDLIKAIKLFFVSKDANIIKENFDLIKNKMINFYKFKLFGELSETEDLIDYEYQIQKTSHEELKEIFEEMLKKYDDMKLLFAEYKEKSRGFPFMKSIENSIDIIKSAIDQANLKEQKFIDKCVNESDDPKRNVILGNSENINLNSKNNENKVKE